MRSLFLLIIATVLLAACKTGPKQLPEPETPPPAAPAPTAEEAPPAPPPVPPTRVPTTADKREAQDSALRAASLLDEGKEAEAKLELEKARALDPNNALAETLRFSITADPVATLGTKSFRYTVKPGDRLSKLSEQYLKDQYKFYLLARYNNLPVPRLQVGQVIRIPGTGPIRPPVQDKPATRIEDVTARPKQPGSAEAEGLYQEGTRRLQAGDKDGAYDLFAQAARLDPKYRTDADRLRPDLVSLHDRKAREAYKRQELDLSIREWNRVLELDPSNEIARLERQRAVDLQAHLERVN
jgi:tetratricopeptide (TPR) repeat protein